VGLGIVLGRKLPEALPFYLGKFLFWIGTPISIITFLRQTDLSGSVWIAPVAAWAAILLGAGLAWAWIKGQLYLEELSRLGHLPTWLEGLTTLSHQRSWSNPRQGSFLLSAMIGNTGYLGYPVALTLVGPQYFAWALFYDILGSTSGAYGLGVVLAARFGLGNQSLLQLLQALLSNPGLGSLVFGLGFRQVSLPPPVEQGLEWSAWTIVTLSLLLMGMRLSQITSWYNLKPASISLLIKMLLVPLILGLALPYVGVVGSPQLAIVLQMSMPPAFATLIIAEVYNLDRDLTVVALATGSVGLLLTLPIWVWLFTT
jgi:predicted permease